MQGLLGCGSEWRQILQHTHVFDCALGVERYVEDHDAIGSSAEGELYVGGRHNPGGLVRIACLVSTLRSPRGIIRILSSLRATGESRQRLKQTERDADT